MNYQQLIVLLPCHSLEDFPTHHEGDDAAGLLAAWTALWHPGLIANAGKMPSWYRADSPPEDVTKKLIVVPGLSQSQLPTGYLQRIESEAACLISNQLDRSRIIATALECLEMPVSAAAEDLAPDFLALGYCFLQVELLTRKLRYSSNLDEIHFQNQTVAAATAAIEGNTAEARSRLGTAFDLLASERDHYYPGEAFLLDVTMLVPATLGESLRSQLEKNSTCNLLLSGELLAEMENKEPASLELLQAAVQAERVGLVGGEYGERRGALVSCETLLTDFRQGLDAHQRTFGRRPKVFGRRRYGLMPCMPQILTKLGFDAALHATFEEGVVPEGSQVKVRWEGCDGTPITAIARVPLDAAKPQTFLNLGVKLGESMDMDHIATVCLAHWPGTPSPWYEDLRRIAGYGTALGRFITLEEYFRTTDYPVHQDRFTCDQYRSPYLRQMVAGQRPDPISCVVRYWRRRAAAESAQTLDTLATLAAGKAPAIAADPSNPATVRPQDLLTQIDLGDEPAEAADLDAAVQAARQRSAQRLAEALPRSAAAAESGYLVANPHSFVRRVGLEFDQLQGLPTIARPIYSASPAGPGARVVVDVPPLGFAWVAPGPPAAKASKANATLADVCVLRNEIFEAHIDPTTGGLRAIHEYDARKNRLSQQLAVGLGEPRGSKRDQAELGTDADPLASIMRADSIETTVSTETLGEIVTRGRLLDRQGRPLAQYRQTYRLWRGSRVLLLDIELQPQHPCAAEPWNSYYAARFAWANEAAELYRGINLTRQPAKGKRFEAPLYVEVDNVGIRTAILTGGLAFHRRYGLRMLDTLLIVSGERCRRFQLGIGVELKNPLHDALQLLAPPPVVAQAAAPPGPASSSWLFHVDARNVTATHWDVLSDGTRPMGFRVRLLETLGRAAKVGVQAFRPIASARKCNFQGDTLAECPIEGGAIQLPMSAHEWVEVEARW